MARLRVVSVVEETWGRGTVYGEEKEPSTPNICATQSSQEIPVKPETSIHEGHKYESYEQRDSEVVQHEIDYFGLSYLEASLFATIMEDTMMEIRILVECNNKTRVLKTDVDMSLLIAIKFDITQPSNVDELEGIDPHILGCNSYKLNKLEADRKYFKDTIITVYKELTLYKSFESLRDNVKSILQEEYDKEALFEDEARNRILRRDLNKQLRQQRNHFKTVIYDADSNMDILKYQVEDASLNAEMRSRYVENWQRARTEQHLQTIEDMEAKPCNTIEYYKRRIDYEQRVHSEVELMSNILINETLEKIDKWMEKYDKDMEGIDLKIQIKKNDFQNMRDQRIDLENTIEKHDTLMKEWIHFKEEREKARLYHKKMTNSAIIVQAWWRGLLVRRQLGPFKVAKKKGGADKKKK